MTETPHLAVRVTRDAMRHVRAGHPWVFESSITSVKPDGVAGDLAIIFDDRRRFAAVGLYDPASPIRIKVLHHGDPLRIDGSFWRERLQRAADVRAAAFGQATTAWRWVHGENDGLPGLVLDRYADVVVAKVYTAAWLPHLDDIVAAIADVAPARAVVLRLARTVRTSTAHGRADGDFISGHLDQPRVAFSENGLTFEADVVHGQKTGWFLDQRDNRTNVRSRASGRSVLDVFCAGGGFSVNAAAGGATSVRSVDVSRHAIDDCLANMARNADRPNVAACRHETIVGEAEPTMARLARHDERYGMVIVDPPSFASRASQIDGALRAYGRLTRLAVALVEPGGTLVQASCSSRVSAVQLAGVVRDAAAEAGAELDDVVVTGHAVDHPIGFPEGAYLNAVFARVRPTGTRRRR